ncbi:hypothetical protein RJT34_21805 [Clitoria ternatea]|uniref:Uncharacterized protein n=1 Tax=Clitoria ternatea TaxID=43366 RepID=A0AAN9P6T1_CLITE
METNHHTHTLRSWSKEISDPKPPPQSPDSPCASGIAPPEFHNGVFKDLAVATESVRECVVKKMVMKLKEVQNAYDTVKEKEIARWIQVRNGLDNFAPSVRYVIRRLIRGVSSTRELVLLSTENFPDVF